MLSQYCQFFLFCSTGPQIRIFIDAWFLQRHEYLGKTEIGKDQMLALDSLHTRREEKRREEGNNHFVMLGRKDRKIEKPDVQGERRRN